MKTPQTITLAFTGASGMPYGLRVLEWLLAAGCRVYLIYSPAAQFVAKQQCDLVLPALLQHDVGGALDQVVGQAMRDRTQRAHAAGADGHRVGGIRAGRHR